MACVFAATVVRLGSNVQLISYVSLQSNQMCNKESRSIHRNRNIHKSPFSSQSHQICNKQSRCIYRNKDKHKSPISSQSHQIWNKNSKCIHRNRIKHKLPISFQSHQICNKHSPCIHCYTYNLNDHFHRNPTKCATNCHDAFISTEISTNGHFLPNPTKFATTTHNAFIATHININCHFHHNPTKFPTYTHNAFISTQIYTNGHFHFNHTKFATKIHNAFLSTQIYGNTNNSCAELENLLKQYLRRIRHGPVKPWQEWRCSFEGSSVGLNGVKPNVIEFIGPYSKAFWSRLLLISMTCYDEWKHLKPLTFLLQLNTNDCLFMPKEAWEP